MNHCLPTCNLWMIYLLGLQLIIFLKWNGNFIQSFCLLIYIQALPNRQEALIVSPWPQTSLPRLSNSIKKFENLQALVSGNAYSFLLLPRHHYTDLSITSYAFFSIVHGVSKYIIKHCFMVFRLELSGMLEQNIQLNQ